MKPNQLSQYAIAAFLLVTLTGCSTVGPSHPVRVEDGIAFLNSWGPPYILLHMPEGYRIEAHKGPDFDVYYVSRRKKPDATLGIYLGHHPKPIEKTGSDVEQIKSTVLGKESVWLRSREPTESGSTFFHEAVLVPGVFDASPKESEHGIICHLFIGGRDLEEIRSLQRLTEGLKVTQEEAADNNGVQPTK